MPTNTTPAAFKLDNYLIKRVNFVSPEEEEVTLELTLSPSGKYTKADGKFALDLVFYGHNRETKSKIFEVQVVAFFDIKTEEDFPEHFYASCIPVVFPYVRAFISTVTLQANIEPIILPLLNLTTMAKAVKDNTVVE